MGHAADSPIPWLPLLALCPACKVSGYHAHEPHRILAPVFDALNLSASSGGKQSLVVDGGTSFDMTEGMFALRRGFKVVGVEARNNVYGPLLSRLNATIASGNLTLLHAALGAKAGALTYIYNARDATSTSLAATGRYAEWSNPLMKEAVITTTIDNLVGPEQPCTAVKLDLQGAEHDAILGAERLLRRPTHTAPVIIFELYESFRPDLPGLPTVRFLRSHGYVCYDVASRPAFKLPDGSLGHRHRCCATSHSIKSGTGSGGPCTTWRDSQWDDRDERARRREDPDQICGPSLATDLLCVKPWWSTAQEEEERAMRTANKS